MITTIAQDVVKKVIGTLTQQALKGVLTNMNRPMIEEIVREEIRKYHAHTTTPQQNINIIVDQITIVLQQQPITIHYDDTPSLAVYPTAAPQPKTIPHQAPKQLPRPTHASLPTPTTTKTPFVFSDMVKVHSVAECLEACKRDRQQALIHFKRGVFEPWMQRNGSYKLAETVQRIRQKKENDMERLAYFMKACRQSENIVIRDPFGFRNTKISRIWSLADACQEFSTYGIYYLNRGDFEKWFKHNSLQQLATRTSEINRRAESDSHRLEYFIDCLALYVLQDPLKHI